MRFARLFIAIATFGSAHALAASHPVMGIWKYSGKDFNQVSFREVVIGSDHYASTAALRVAGDGSRIRSPYLPQNFRSSKSVDYTFWSSNPVKAEIEKNQAQLPNQDCTLLTLNQLFSVTVMKNRGVISEDYANALLSSSVDLKPDQVTFIEAVRTESETMLKRKYGKVPDDARLSVRQNDPTLEADLKDEDWNRYFESYAREGEETEEDVLHWRKRKIEKAALARRENRKYYDVKSATAWLVSGQTPEGLARLPLEGKIGSHLTTAIDRKQYPMIWELGRVAQMGENDIPSVFKLALDQAAHEASLMGRPMSDAYIMAHAPDRAHRILYEREYGLKPILQHHDGKDHWVLVGKLDECRAIIDRKLARQMNPENPVVATIEPKMSGLKQKFAVVRDLPDQKVSLRDFSDTKREQPPISLFDEYTREKGAKDPFEEYSFRRPDFRHDRLHDRMEQYYYKEGKFSFAPYDQLERHDHDYFVRSRYYDLNAIVVDDSRNHWTDEMDWNRALISATEFAKQKNAKNIVVPVLNRIDPEFQKLVHGLNAKEEMVFFDPLMTHTHRVGPFMEYTTQTGGGAGYMMVIPIEDANAYVQKLPAQIRKQATKQLSDQTLMKQYWSVPLYSL